LWLRFVPDVLNLPLRSPAVMAKSVASLDVLSGGRVELGLGAGAFWDAVEAMGGPRRTAKESVDALEEALAIIRGFWSGERSVSFQGDHYGVKGVHPGAPPGATRLRRDPMGFIRRLGEDVAPTVRELAS
jgi:alkanesulfonate monooxygenase SsuD/methylene tetrahydromethanopterin reductase-like flavin-dependent oxidoreductase (luciferase family)